MYLRSRGDHVVIITISIFASGGLGPSALAAGATRDLSDYAGAGASFTVSISINSPPGTMAVIVEDSPPVGWTAIGNISNGGAYDSDNHKVKWGPFFDPDIPSPVSYDITPPGDASGDDCFAGIVSFDGFDEPIEGNQCIADVVPAVSEWGIVVMTLLMLTAGTLVIGRRRRIPLRSAA